MDFFDIGHKDKIDKDQMELLQRKKHEYHFIGSQQKVRGHTVFSFNTVTHELKVADITRCNVFDMQTMGPAYNNKISVEPNCVYLQALNKKNAIKHLRRLGYEI